MKKILKIRLLKEEDIKSLQKHFDKPRERYLGYLIEMRKGKRVVLVAELKGDSVAFATLCLTSKYPPFKKAKIPEIVDLNVGENYRRQGIARKLILYMEKWVKNNIGKTIGIGVGMEPGYGSAQRLYVKMGYTPDGRGLTYNYNPVKFGKSYPADDSLVLFFTKEL